MALNHITWRDAKSCDVNIYIMQIFLELPDSIYNYDIYIMIERKMFLLFLVILA